MPIHGVMLTSILVVLLCLAWTVAFVATAIARYRGFKISIDRPGVQRLDAAWFVAMVVLLAGLAILAATYVGGELR